MRYDDRRSMGPSNKVPYIRGEAPMDRHDRRRRDNFERGRQTVREWCESHGLFVTISNERHHWVFRLNRDRKRIVAQWWPSSAKFVYGEQYDRGIHVHDWEQCIAALSKASGLPEV